MSGTPAPRRRRRRWPVVLLVVVLVLAALAVGGGAWAEGAARDRATRTASTTLADRLGVPADRIRVDLGPGLLLPQLLSGRVDRVHVTGDDLPVQGVTGSIDARLGGVAVDGSSTRTLDATVTVPGSSLSRLAAGAGGPKVDAIRVDGTHLVADASASVLGISLPVSVSLAPSASKGAVVLTPTSVKVGGTTIDAGSLRTGPLAGIAGRYLAPTRVCVVDRLPAGLDLRTARVVGTDLVLRLHGRDIALRGAQRGTCG